MATTTQGEAAMKTITEYLYLSDSGRCTCADHAGEYLRHALNEKPNARILTTIMGTWERMEKIIVHGYGIECDGCKRAEIRAEMAA